MATPPDPGATAVLVVDDDVHFAGLVCEVVRDQGLRADLAHDFVQAAVRVSRGDYAVAVVDIVIPGGSGMDLIRHIRATSPDTQIVILTGHASLPTAIAGIRSGVVDYIQKAELDVGRLALIVGSAAERWRLMRHNRDLVEGLRQGNLRLQSLHQATARLAAADHPDRVLEVLVDAARGLLRAQRVLVALFDQTHEGTALIRGAVGDGAGVLTGVRLQPGEGVAAHVALTGQPVMLRQPQDEPHYSARCDDLGAADPGFLCVPLRQAALRGALSAAGHDHGFEEDDRLMAETLATQAAVALDMARKNERAVNFFTHTCDILVSVLENVDVHLPGHSRASAALADMVTRRLGLADEERRNIHFGALLHDIGKIRLEPELLREPGRLTPKQAERMREHAVLGVELLKPISLWEDVLPMIGTHHERWDGTGYPSGLAGDDIPLGARVIAVAEAFDAMTRHYPNRPGKTPEEALAELQACAGSQFDPRIVRLFVAEYRNRPPT